MLRWIESEEGRDGWPRRGAAVCCPLENAARFYRHCEKKVGEMTKDEEDEMVRHCLCNLLMRRVTQAVRKIVGRLNYECLKPSGVPPPSMRALPRYRLVAQQLFRPGHSSYMMDRFCKLVCLNSVHGVNALMTTVRVLRGAAKSLGCGGPFACTAHYPLPMMETLLQSVDESSSILFAWTRKRETPIPSVVLPPSGQKLINDVKDFVAEYKSQKSMMKGVVELSVRGKRVRILLKGEDGRRCKIARREESRLPLPRRDADDEPAPSIISTPHSDTSWREEMSLVDGKEPQWTEDQ